jgi:hypothetical protein
MHIGKIRKIFVTNMAGLKEYSLEVSFEAPLA